MKIAATAALAALLAWPVASEPWTIPTLEEHVYKTNVLLNEGCSGTVIDADRGLILTAYHCRKDEGQVIELRVYDGADVLHQTITPAAVVAEDPAHDLMLLKVDARLPFGFEATLYEGDPPVGSDVWVVGNPLARFDSTVSKGILGSKHEVVEIEGDERHYWVIDARSIGGNSGGAAYVDGRLIGVLSGGMMAPVYGPVPIPLGINFIVPLPTVSAFLAEYDAAA